MNKLKAKVFKLTAGKTKH